MKKRPTPTNPLRKFMKIAAWTVMAIVLTVAAVTICAVRLLEPAQLTPLVVSAANSMFDAEVSIKSVDLSLHGKTPFIRLQVDSLLVISKPMRRLRDGGNKDIPLWADTLLRLERFEGSISPAALIAGKIDLRDVILTTPEINLFTVNEQHSSYLVFTPSDTATASPSDTPSKIPPFSINHFSIVNPRPLRFGNMATGEHFTLALSSLSIDSDGEPVYAVRMDGDVASPSLGIYNLEKLKFGVNGGIGWDPEHPAELALDRFKLTADFLEATVDARVDFSRDIIVRDFSIDLGEMGIERILSVIPDSIKEAYDLTPRMLSTDMALVFSARSTAPFNITTDSVPSAEIELLVKEGSLRLGQARFDKVGGRVHATLKGNDIDSAVFIVKDFTICGPATNLTINAEATRVQHDPLISGCVRGSTRLERLPSKLLDLVGGALSGHVTADIDFCCTPSMLNTGNFHRIVLKGDIDARNLYYLANDTNLMVFAGNSCLKFGTNEHFGQNTELLAATIKVDSTEIITGDAAMTLTDLALGVGTTKPNSRDTTVIVPMGGCLRFKSLNVSLLDHETTIKVRNVDGRVSLQRYKNNRRLPLFKFDLGIKYISFGSATTRMMLAGSNLSLEANRLPHRRVSRRVQRTADSLRRARPDMPADSVYAYALRKHRPNPDRPHRVHPQYTDSASEIIYWGTAPGIRRLLLKWQIRGSVSSRRAGLFTAAFPIRNRLSDFNATFNNDSVVMTDVKYKAGSSDFLISGCISNMKRAFTSRSFTQPVRINFDVLSDTIDVNELAGTAFKGAAAVRAETAGHHRFDIDAIEAAEEAGDSVFEHEIGRMVADAPDSVAPLLVPTNIDLKFNMRADNVRYSDILFHDFTGELLAFGGALNLHKLSATSDVGSVDLSALYAAPNANDMRFGFGLDVDRFNIARFMQMVPALDSIMPLLRDFRGIVDARIAATCDIDRSMNFVLPTLSAAIRLQGDSLELIDHETYRKIGKWLMFKDKQRNIIDHMNVEMTVRDNVLQMYPFIFNIDRYKLGVQGYNDLALNFNYHIAVLKSPLPFKFGVNISGNPDHYKIRLGGARLKENLPTNVAIVDTTRINLLNEIENVFRRGVTRAHFRGLDISRTPLASEINLDSDTITAADSAVFIREGLIPAPVKEPSATDDATQENRRKKPARQHRNNREATLKQ